MDAGQEFNNEIYNIILIHNLLEEHPALKFPEVRAAIAALLTVGDLRKPLFVRWHDGLDLIDWLGAFFGFQKDNVRNQREHLVLLLANAQMRLHPPPDNIGILKPSVVKRLRKKLLHNYNAWRAFLGRKSNLWASDSSPITRRSMPDPRKDLMYTALYLLIWGEAANLRFMPECLCYIFHHMAVDLNRILEDYIDESTGRPALPTVSGTSRGSRKKRKLDDSSKGGVEDLEDDPIAEVFGSDTKKNVLN